MTPTELVPMSSGRWQGEVKLVSDLADHELALWQHLTETRPELRSPYFSLEFALAVAEAGARARVCLLYRDGILAGFFPFQFSGGLTQGMAAAERIGGILNDFCGVLLDRSQHPPIGVDHLLRCARLSTFEFSHLEEKQTDLGPCGIRSDGARIRLDCGPAQYWASVKAHHGSQYDTLRNRDRKISRDFRDIEFTFTHQDINDRLHLLIAEKRKQFERTGADDEALADGWALRCLQHIAGYQKGRCVPVFSSLYLDGRWAALHFGIRSEGVLHYWFPVYNEQFRKMSPGLVLLSKMIDAAPSYGIHEIDLGEGLTTYKTLLGNELYSVFRGIWHRSDPRALLYRGSLSLGWRLRGLRQWAHAT